MSMDNQDQFLRTIRKALGVPPQVRRSPELLSLNEGEAEAKAILDRVASRKLEDRKALLQRLIEAAGPLRINVVPCKDASEAASAIGQLVRDKAPEWGTEKSVIAWRHPLVDRLNLPQILAEQQVPVFVADSPEAEAAGDIAEAERASVRRRIIQSYIGVTSADFCVAETATLVLKTRPGQARSVSLVPSIHVAVIELDQILADLKELYAVLKGDPAQSKEGLTNVMTLISGPSKTADIELVMVHGAHGPRELHLIVIVGDGMPSGFSQ